MITLQEHFKKAFCYQKLFWPFIVWMNCSCDLKFFANSWPSASNLKPFSRSLEHFFFFFCQNIFGNKIPLFMHCFKCALMCKGKTQDLKKKYLNSYLFSKYFYVKTVSNWHFQQMTSMFFVITAKYIYI